MRKPAAAPSIAAHQHQKGPKPGRKKMAVVGTVYQVDRYQRTPEAVVQALFREPGAAAPREEAAPSRPGPEHKRSRVNLTDPEAATPVGASAAMFAWLTREARSRDPGEPRPWVVIMDGQPSLWEEAKQALGEAPRVEILDSAPCHQPPLGCGAPVPCTWQRARAEADGAVGVGAALGNERGDSEFTGGCSGGGRARQESTAAVDQDLQLLASPSGPDALQRVLGRWLPDRFRGH